MRRSIQGTSSQKGYSLVEVVIATGILAVVITGAVILFERVFAARNQGQGSASALEEAAMVATRIKRRAQIMQTFALPNSRTFQITINSGAVMTYQTSCRSINGMSNLDALKKLSAAMNQACPVIASICGADQLPFIYVNEQPLVQPTQKPRLTNNIKPNEPAALALCGSYNSDDQSVDVNVIGGYINERGGAGVVSSGISISRKRAVTNSIKLRP